MSEQGVDGVALVKQNLKVSTIVARYAPLQKRGNRQAACCPIHHEKTPSFYVDDAQGFFHCFGCGAGGDVIKFTMEMEKFSFREALEFLADIAGVELPRLRGKGGPSRELVDQIRAINEAAVVFYQKQLHKNKTVEAYLEKRGIQRNTRELFGLGYAGSQWDGLYEHLRAEFDPKVLAQSGLVRPSSRGNTIDLFRERVIFPIRDAFGHPIAFGGRLIEGDGPKYINSPETPLYTKGKHLYNMDFAKPYLKRDPEVVVVEGYMDAIQVYQAGIGAVVAGLGTAFTPEQAKLLKRYAKKAILNFDGDAAGFKAARTTIETLLAVDVDLGVVSLPDKLDPDDYIKQHGLESYKEQLSRATGFFDFLATYLKQGEDLVENPRQRSFVAQEMCHTINCIGDIVVREHWVAKLGEKLDLSPQILTTILAEQMEKQPPVQQPPETPVRRHTPILRGAFTKLEEEFLFHMMHEKDFTRFFSDENREALPGILTHVFADKRWLVNFIFAERTSDQLEDMMAHVPETFRPTLRTVYLKEEEFTADHERLSVIFPDILRKMLRYLMDRNRRLLRTLTDEGQKRELMSRNRELNLQYHQLAGEG